MPSNGLTPDQKELSELLDSIRNARRIYRDQAAEIILVRPELMPALVRSVFSNESKRSVKAAWVLELVCLYEVRLMIPYIAEFATNLERLEDESSIRPVSKICSQVSKLYIDEPWEPFDPDSNWISGIINSSFEWLIGEHKAAAKVFSMETLFQWGKKYDWIHPELNSILDINFAKESCGYQSRARKIMDKISASERLKRQK